MNFVEARDLDVDPVTLRFPAEANTPSISCLKIEELVLTDRSRNYHLRNDFENPENRQISDGWILVTRRGKHYSHSHGRDGHAC